MKNNEQFFSSVTVLVVFYSSLKIFATSLTTTNIISCLFISLPPPFQPAFQKKVVVTFLAFAFSCCLV